MTKLKSLYGFYIILTIVILFPAIEISQLFSYLLAKIPVNFIQKLANLNIIETPSTIAIIFLFFLIYEKYLWKMTKLQRIVIHKVPYIAGRYKGFVKSSYKDGKKYDIVLEIKQSLSNTRVSLFTKRSSSFSTTSAIVVNEHNNHALNYGYSNKPKTIKHDKDMRVHSGYAELEIFEKEKKLVGRYFNDSRERQTYGSLECNFTNKILLGRYS